MKKGNLRAHYARVGVFKKDDNGNYAEAGSRWMKVRANAAIPDGHRMFK